MKQDFLFHVSHMIQVLCLWMLICLLFCCGRDGTLAELAGEMEHLQEKWNVPNLPKALQQQTRVENNNNVRHHRETSHKVGKLCHLPLCSYIVTCTPKHTCRIIRKDAGNASQLLQIHKKWRNSHVLRHRASRTNRPSFSADALTSLLFSFSLALCGSRGKSRSISDAFQLSRLSPKVFK